MAGPHPTLYGLPNCDTVKRARAWFADQGQALHFHDFRKDGVPAALAGWAEAVGWARLLNRQGTTWRRLDPAQAAAVVDAPSALALMAQAPAVIRRPVVVWPDGGVTVGFDPADFSSRLARR